MCRRTGLRFRAVIENNVFRSTFEGIQLTNFNPGTGLPFPEATTVIIRQNVITNSVSSAIQVYHVGEDPFTDPATVFVINNTIAGSGSGGTSNGLAPESSLSFSPTYGQIALLNNIVTQATVRPVLECASGYDTLLNRTPVILDHNDFYNPLGPVAGAACGDPSGSAYGNISVDPQFVAAADLHLRQGSPAIEAGNNGAYYLPETDLDGGARVQAANGGGYATVDMGAYESPGAVNVPRSAVGLTSSSYYLAAPGTITLSALLQAGTGATAPAAGTVTFYENNVRLAAVAADGTGKAGLNVVVTKPGIHGYRAHGEDGVSATDSPVVYVYLDAPGALATATSLVVSPTTANALAPVTLTATVMTTTAAAVPAGTVTFYDGAVALGSKPLGPDGTVSLVTTALLPGNHLLHGVYAGNGTFAGSASGNVGVTILPFATAVMLTASPATAVLQQQVALTATVTIAGGGAATGTVTFLDGTTPIGMVAVDAAGHAVLTTNSLAVGGHAMTAQFAASASLAGSLSNAVTVTILPPDFTISAGLPALTIRTEHHAPVQVTITTSGGLADTIQLSCGSLPTFVSCTFDPGDVTTSGEATETRTATLTIDTDAVLGYAQLERGPGLWLERSLAVAILLSPGLLPGRRRDLRVLLAALVAVAMVFGAGGCSGKYPGHAAPGSYPVMITGAGRATGITHSVTLELTVTP